MILQQELYDAISSAPRRPRRSSLWKLLIQDGVDLCFAHADRLLVL